MVLAIMSLKEFAQFCNSFHIKSQRQLKAQLPTQQDPTKDIYSPIHSSTTCPHLHRKCPVAAPLSMSRTGVVCTSPGPVSNTSSELTKPESPSATT